MKHIALPLALFSLTLSTAALAQSANDPRSGTGNLNFSALDTDRNGALTSSELNAAGLSESNLFGGIDTNSDGAISSSEFATWNVNNTAPGSVARGSGAETGSGSGNVSGGEASGSGSGSQ